MSGIYKMSIDKSKNFVAGLTSFSNVSGFLTLPLTRDLDAADVFVLGVPYDLATTGRAGTRGGRFDVTPFLSLSASPESKKIIKQPSACPCPLPGNGIPAANGRFYRRVLHWFCQICAFRNIPRL